MRTETERELRLRSEELRKQLLDAVALLDVFVTELKAETEIPMQGSGGEFRES
jgi:hypothetical protein